MVLRFILGLLLLCYGGTWGGDAVSASAHASETHPSSADSTVAGGKPQDSLESLAAAHQKDLINQEKFQATALQMQQQKTISSSKSKASGKGAPKKNADIATSQELKDLIQLLEDPEKRDPFLKKLKSLKSTLEKTQEAESPFLSHLVVSFAQFIEANAQRLIQASVACFHFPEHLWKACARLGDPQEQKLPLFFLLGLITILLGGLVCEVATYLLLRWLYRLAQPADTSEPSARSRYFHLLRRRIIPLSVFAVSTWMGTAALVAFEKKLLLSLTKTVTFVILVRFIWMVLKILLEPKGKGPRFIPVEDGLARYLYRVALTLGQLVLFGFVTYQTFFLLKMAPEGLLVWSRAVGFILSIFLISLLLEHKVLGTKWILASLPSFSKQGGGRAAEHLSFFFAKTWHWWATLAIGSLYIAWAFQTVNEMVFLLQGFSGTTVVIVVLLFLHHFLNTFSQKGQDSERKSTITDDKTWSSAVLWGKGSSLAQSAYTFIPFFQGTLVLLGGLLILKSWGINLLGALTREPWQSYMMILLTCGTFLILGAIIWRAMDLALSYQLRPIQKEGQWVQPSLFVKTIAPIARNLGRVLLVASVGALILSELNIHMVTFLYGFGVAGLALSFGSQSFVKDLLNGIFTLLEGNIAVGECVVIGPHTGIVEAITLRSVFLRHSNGSLQTIPFSEVNSIINRSRDYTVSTTDLALPYTTDLKTVYTILQTAADELVADPRFTDLVVEPLRIRGVDRFTETALHVVADLRTKPDPSNVIVREFNRLVTLKFRAKGIEQPIIRQIVEVSEVKHSPTTIEQTIKRGKTERGKKKPK